LSTITLNFKTNTPPWQRLLQEFVRKCLTNGKGGGSCKGILSNWKLGQFSCCENVTGLQVV